MDQSLSLVSAQVQFMEDRLALVHIPLDLYPYFLYPIMQVLFHEVPPLHENSENGENSTSVHAQPAFLNLSITPVECSIMCPRHLANQYFAPLFHFLHLDLLLRLHHCSSSQQSSSDRGVGEARLPIRDVHGSLHQQQSSFLQQLVQSGVLTTLQHSGIPARNTSAIVAG
ncbi:predicted protein [Aspergillus terreus NIH2624]|uniref:Uncharacterized protein n=1 Tax=Aspergillus terreus (strain NIH 2624 / FGSC A1156) TaxID=341663 RepID=Q0CAJ7_ASPTN|nr:uncharacterized protein ATEG_09287 [Aspergillus terreus NIH2624]EAU30424.1 predicted protein [Aspergillus terreus NIH2624]